MKILAPLSLVLVTTFIVRFVLPEMTRAAALVTQDDLRVPVTQSPVVPQPGIVNGVPGADPSDADPAADGQVPPTPGAVRNRNRYPNPRRPGGPPPVHPAERLLNQSTGGPAEARVP